MKKVYFNGRDIVSFQELYIMKLEQDGVIEQYQCIREIREMLWKLDLESDEYYWGGYDVCGEFARKYGE